MIATSEEHRHNKHKAGDNENKIESNSTLIHNEPVLRHTELQEHGKWDSDSEITVFIQCF
jgi:hypothetical protein